MFRVQTQQRPRLAAGGRQWTAPPTASIYPTTPPSAARLELLAKLPPHPMSETPICMFLSITISKKGNGRKPRKTHCKTTRLQKLNQHITQQSRPSLSLPFLPLNLYPLSLCANPQPLLPTTANNPQPLLPTTANPRTEPKSAHTHPRTYHGLAIHQRHPGPNPQPTLPIPARPHRLPHRAQRGLRESDPALPPAGGMAAVR